MESDLYLNELRILKKTVKSINSSTAEFEDFRHCKLPDETKISLFHCSSSQNTKLIHILMLKKFLIEHFFKKNF